MAGSGAPTRTPHGKTALGTVLSPLLSFGNMEHFAHCDVGERTPSLLKRRTKFLVSVGGTWFLGKNQVLKLCYLESIPEKLFLFADKGDDTISGGVDFLGGRLSVLAVSQLDKVTELIKAGKIHLKVGFPGVIHNPGINRASIVLCFPIAQEDGMVLELSHIQQGSIRGTNYHAVFFSLIDHAIVGNIIFHTGSRDLVHARAHQDAALLDKGFAVLSLQGEGQIEAFNIFRKGFGHLISKINAGQGAVQLQDYGTVIGPLQLITQFHPDKHRTLIQDFDIGQLGGKLFGVQPPDIPADQAAFFINTLTDFCVFIYWGKEFGVSIAQHFLLFPLVIKGSDTLADFIGYPEEIVFDPIRQGIGAVSYTHLDVYKRQVYITVSFTACLNVKEGR